MNKKKIISVVIPVYKVEQYLSECVDSILNQTYDALEIILVDDGSPDSCGKICDEYAKRDSRIKVIHKENGGLSDARNAGIDIASGDYITFVDSDDYIAKDMIEKLYSALIKNNADVSLCARYCFGDKIETFIFPEKNECIVLGEKNKYESLDFILHNCWEAWSKLFKINLFKEFRYPKGVLYEDFSLTPKIFFYVSRSVFIPEGLYYYRIRDDSIMTQIPQSKVDLIRNADENIEFFLKNNIDKKIFNSVFKSIKTELNRKRMLADRNTSIGKEFIEEFVGFEKKYRKFSIMQPKTLYMYIYLRRKIKRLLRS